MTRALLLAAVLLGGLPALAEDGGPSASPRAWEATEFQLRTALRVGDAAESRRHLRQLGRVLDASAPEPGHKERAEEYQQLRREVEALEASSL
jgi:hypothetical protein